MTRFYFLAVLCLVFFLGVPYAQAPATEEFPASFKFSSLPQGVPVELSVEALGPKGNRLEKFNESVLFKGLFVYTSKKSGSLFTEEVSDQTPVVFKEGSALLSKAEIRDKNVVGLFNGKEIPSQLSFYPVTFKIKPMPRHVPIKIVIEACGPDGKKIEQFNKEVQVDGLLTYQEKKTERKEGDQTIIHREETVESKPVQFTFEQGTLAIPKAEVHEKPVKLTYDEESSEADVYTFSPWLTIIPPLLAILLAIITKEVVISLFIGTWVGVFFLTQYQPVGSFIQTFDTYIINTISNRSDYTPIIFFTLLIGGMIGILARSGGMHDLVEKASRWARTPRSGMIASWASGVLIFFDDYASILLRGNSLRPITDRLRISREKLSYIIDSSAAPIASLTFISTWIGTELGYISAGLSEYGQGQRAFEYFLNSIPCRYYSVFGLVFVFLVAYMMRDFGPMYRAEKRARTTGQVIEPGSTPLAGDDISALAPPEGKPCRWYNGLVPILVMVVVTLCGLYYSGIKSVENSDNASLRDIIQAANSFEVLIWAAVWSTVTAGVMVAVQRILKVTEIIAAWVQGLKSMLLALIVLVLAWTLKDICAAMYTNKFIFFSTKDFLSVEFLPVLSFVIACVVAFATGTSWGTMGLLFPLVLPLSIELSVGKGMAMDTTNFIIVGTTASILSGASFGDHCSPISDTTVMSSMCCACDHIDHVKTQMPYAVFVALVSAVFGYIPAGFGVSPWICIPLGCIVMVLFLKFYGKKVDEEVVGGTV